MPQTKRAREDDVSRRAAPRSLADRAAQQIREMIVDGTLELGKALSETALAGDLGVSKTPIREAFVRLETERLVRILPQRGTFVFELGLVDAEQLCSFRCILETEALKLAMSHGKQALLADMRAIVSRMKPGKTRPTALSYRALDDQFHRCILIHSRNSYLTDAYDNIALIVQALRNRLAVDSYINERSMREHKELVRFIAKGQVDRAVAVLKLHISHTPTDYARHLDLKASPLAASRTLPPLNSR